MSLTNKLWMVVAVVLAVVVAGGLAVRSRIQAIGDAAGELEQAFGVQRLSDEIEITAVEVGVEVLSQLTDPDPNTVQVLEQALAELEGAVSRLERIRPEAGLVPAVERYTRLAEGLIRRAGQRSDLDAQAMSAFDDLDGAIVARLESADGAERERLVELRQVVIVTREQLSVFRRDPSPTRLTELEGTSSIMEDLAQAVSQVGDRILPAAARVDDAIDRIAALEPVVAAERRLFRDTRGEIDRLLDEEIQPQLEEDVAREVATTSAAVSDARRIQLALLGALVIVGVMAVVVLRRTVVDRILRLAGAADRVSEGNIDEEVPVEGRDEIAHLTAGFNEMVASWRAAEAQLEGDNRLLRRLDEMKDEFVASVSHELRTPLTAIVAYTELLLDGEPGPLTEEQREFLQVMDRSSQRLRRMVDDLLLMARMDAGSFSLQPSRVDLGAVAAEVVADACLQAQRNGVELVLDTEPLPVFQADRSRLGQLLDNLVSNAVKFTPRGGRVMVVVRREGQRAVIEVTDTGIGIPPEERHQIFQRFFRTSRSRETTIQGSGIGLTIVKSVAEAHGGSVSLRSTNDSGTTFRVEIPMTGVEVPLGVASSEVSR